MEAYEEETLIKKAIRSEWSQIILMVITITGLFLWNRTESNSDRREIHSVLTAIQQEMKDFHGRLERQDAEFKAHLLYAHSKDQGK